MVTNHSKEPMTMCPMASMCRGMSQKPPSMALTMTPGLVLILIGIVVLIEPKVLAWLVVLVTIIMGVFLLMVAAWIHRMTARFRDAHG
jgi:uncharacterized membrane protein HdeD (DUF308 family)